MTSGRMTPARIWVAPLMEADLPSSDFNNSNVRRAMAMVPKPSVMTRVSVMFSWPVMATPMS